MLKLSGELPDPRRRARSTRTSSLAAEHGMNASTFTARVIVSTLSDLGSGLVGAVGALKGRLHGGAPSHVSHMIDEIGTAENAEPWLRAQARGGRAADGLRAPRLPHVRPAGAGARRGRRGRSRGENERLALARHVEETALRLLRRVQAGPHALHERRVLRGRRARRRRLPPDLYPATFAAARTAGWTAHILEQLQHNRLIRPTVDYVGPMPES